MITPQFVDYKLRRYYNVWANVLLVFWLIGNSFAFAIMTPAHFQRLGSVWIVIVILCVQFTAVVSEEVARRLDEEPEDEFVRKFTDRISFDHTEINDARQGKCRPYDVVGDTSVVTGFLQTEARMTVAAGLRRRLPELRVNEMILAILSTLQWGYGDLLHCLLSGKGWRVC